MLFKLILLFTVVPILELVILLNLGQHIGLWYTIGIVIVTGILGAYLSKKEGRGILQRIKLEIGGGRVPGDELINGLCVIIGGALLLTPGLLTDIAGFTLVLPHTRSLLKETIKNKLKNMIEKGTISFYFRK
ncbi:FxsA family protein [Serpentinicella sp. ANB-PHB4]|uniref:FxsA family protein n=1 Tax=Serpentinicella sp. ANB-PHB4 TaxID=3074076 RepID=UPI00285A5F43|nr:FxsA family protein [Serpentinicella sp. ANB-PHB4]MDR5660031.1 FxsA family protein [Serpentinicella sp. ANB-PHB4]